MKRTCAYCGWFEDEDDILVRCQEPNCSLRSVDSELPGLFHGRYAAAVGDTGSAHWQNCPWCPLAKHAENFDKPDDFEKFDEPDKKHESHKYVCGKCSSKKGESSIFWDCNMKCLSFEESMDDSGYLHGWTGTGTVGKRGWLSMWMRILATRPLVVKSLNMWETHVRLLSETAIETQIKFSDDDEW